MKDHTALVAAVKAAGLVKTLKGPDPFTLFAPTNEAFAEWAPGTSKNLLKPATKDESGQILAYHVGLTTRYQALDAKFWRVSFGQTENRKRRLADRPGSGALLTVIGEKGDAADIPIRMCTNPA